MTRIALTTALVGIMGIGLAVPASGQANTRYQPGNCAVWAEMTADTVAKDARLNGADRTAIKSSLDKYAKAQRAIVQSGMAETYEKSKAFGWDKAKVDAQMKANEDAIRAGFRTPTMEADTVYMDHVLAVYQCGETATTEAQLGQPATEFAAAMNTLSNVVQGR